MKLGLIIIGVLVLIAVLLGGQIVGVRNDLVQQRETVDASWAEVDNQLQRRADLIPNLVETVKGYVKHESDVLNNLANARAGLLNARSPEERIQANQRIDSALGRLLVLVENYPQLQANEQFRNLQFELAGTENRIARARQRYNESVQRYNTSIELFPNNIAASIFGFQRNDAYYKTDPAARQTPKVNF
jgi:LemA protein